MKIAILGTGQWGTALAQVLSDAGNEVRMWGRNTEVADEINKAHRNSKSLPGIELSDSISATTSREEVFADVGAVLFAIPSQSLRETLISFKSVFPQHLPVISSLKGIELGTHLRMTEVIQDVLGLSEDQISIITGPNLAREVVMRQPVGAVTASTSQELADLTAELFHAPYFRAYTSTDVVGCELAAAAKNVIALAVGMAIGMGLGRTPKRS